MMSYYYDYDNEFDENRMTLFEFMFIYFISFTLGSLVGMLLLYTFPEIFESFVKYFSDLIKELN